LTDRNCIGYWFPKLVATGVPVPQTAILSVGDDWRQMINFAEHGDRFQSERAAAEAIICPLADRIAYAAAEVGGFPCFLRTGHFSGKHEWSHACHLPSADVAAAHVRHLVYMSEMFGMFGELPYKTWAVRELLPVQPVCALPEYGGFPLVREVRAFVRDGRIETWHPYWPPQAIADGFPRKIPREPLDEPPVLRDLPDNFSTIIEHVHAIDWTAVRPIVAQVAEAFAGDGGWSVDVLETDGGWFVTDMAIAERSFRWKEGERAP
jgi:hypothetical protein